MNGSSGVHTFLIADIRGYSRFTENFGDEAAAELSRAFANVVQEIVETHEGELREMRGDEALVVFGASGDARCGGAAGPARGPDGLRLPDPVQGRDRDRLR